MGPRLGKVYSIIKLKSNYGFRLFFPLNQEPLYARVTAASIVKLSFYLILQKI